MKLLSVAPEEDEFICDFLHTFRLPPQAKLAIHAHEIPIMHTFDETNIEATIVAGLEGLHSAEFSTVLVEMAGGNKENKLEWAGLGFAPRYLSDLPRGPCPPDALMVGATAALVHPLPPSGRKLPANGPPCCRPTCSWGLFAFWRSAGREERYAIVF